MGLKNYTTSIKVEKTIMEIERILAKAGASSIFKMYDSEGNPNAVGFQTIVSGKPINFKLPMELDKIKQVFHNQGNKGLIPRRLIGDTEQARKTGWRIIKDWVDSQMALLEVHMVKFEEVFLPYMYDMATQKTLFQKIEETGFNLQIEDKNNCS